jgi:hypothetical protein
VISPQLEKLLVQTDRTQKLLWAVLTVSILVYAVIPYLLERHPEPERAATLMPIFMILAAGLAAASLMLRRRVQAATGRGHPTSRPGRTHPLLQAQLDNLSPEESRAIQGVAAAFMPWILSLVLNESVAILGLMLALLGAGPDAGVPFAVLALILNLVMRPDAVGRTRASLGHIGL